jgi:hypothetical protein
MSNTSLAIILLVTLVVTLIAPAVSGISLLQQTKAESYTHSSHLLVLVELLPPKKLASCFITNCGCSSAIQCPELGTITALTS